MLSIFVYGTLKPQEAAYPHYCQPHVERVQAACMRGDLFHLPQGYPAMTAGDRWITGALLGFRQAAAIAAIDQFEDYDPQRPTTENLYQRRLRPVFSPTHQPLGEAWVYLMSMSQVQALGGISVASGVWTQSAFRANSPP